MSASLERPTLCHRSAVHSAALILAIMAAFCGWVRPTGAQGLGGETELPIPRFVSLRSDEVNLRTGPGTTYPVEWVYVRRGLPVEIIAEFDVWRRIRDWQNTVGWVHQSMLDGKRTALVVGSDRFLLQDPADSAAPVARVAPGVIARLLECNGPWCRVEAEGYRGWLKREDFWGSYPKENVE